MKSADSVEILSELLGAEQRSLAVRLLESTVFVPRLGVHDLHLVKRLADQSKERCAELAELIIELGEVPAPCTHDPTSADLHYVELGYAMPRLLADQVALSRMYSQAAELLEEDSPARAFVVRACNQLRQDRPGDKHVLSA